ncbi:TonB-dependent receptor [Brevundimonas sp. NIBR11]|uniref:TonB-dependent receptor domain-containing protein n=1 Tax=Brevundimonas sp. NIBR11 TaxID=3015999 RepID=UPI0022F0E964|nr:TonB-dependent receptor [Brevundimonas sp. NIBR11]WGM30549.1 Vitamin B12 transporter BtuB [Brevundimonas sp. NIBR11]
MTPFKLLLLAATALAVPGAALAQTAPAPRPAAPATPPQTTEDETTTVEEVTVTARQTDVRTSIDSTSYSLADDLQARTGSLADALRNVPSVDVDPQGNVSLRGDGNVTILVDGRPSGVLSGEGRAQALLQMQADRYARIEVMTNPSAAYSPEGSGGVINLITKPNQPRPGAVSTGSIRANVGDDGRWNLGFSGSRTDGPLTLSGDISLRHDTVHQEVTRDRERLDTASGLFLPSRQTQDIDFDSDGVYGRLGLEYRLTEKTSLTVEGRFNDFENTGAGVEFFEGRNASGAITSAYRRDTTVDQTFSAAGITARLLHRFDDAGHEWTNEFRVDEGENGLLLTTAATPTIPAGPNSYERVDQEGGFTVMAFTSAYVRPMGETGKLRLGYELEIRQPDQANTVLRGSTAGTLLPVAGLTNSFDAEQTVHALYATYERPLTEKLSAQFGLRLEQADIEVNQISAGVRATQDYFRAYPTMHLQYQLAESQTLRGSYSKRIQRPAPFQLNPFVSFLDPLNLRSGNPNLQPQETDAFELQWQMRAGQTFYQATAYYRDTTKAFTEVASDLGGGVLLTRPENLGGRTDTGVEFVANGRLHPTLRYNASVNVFRQDIDATGIPGATSRSATQVSGRLALNWQPTAEDFIQVSGQWNGETLLAQGVREGGGVLNLGYRRTLTPTVAFQMTVRDLLNDFGDVTTYDTPTFRDRTERLFSGRAAYIGLTWTFGGGPRRQQDPQFDFSGAPTGG